MKKKDFGKYHDIAIQMARDKVNAVKRGLNACAFVSSKNILLNEYYIRAKQLSILTGEPVEPYESKEAERKRKKIERKLEKNKKSA